MDETAIRQDHQRRLAAITVGDVVGYSALMEADENGTLDRLKRLFADLIEPSVAAFDGRLFKTTGDGFLAEFNSALAAVEHARHLQAAASTGDGGLRLRLGISLGDVVVDGQDLLGHAVNVAARMEALAAPGGICISATVHDHVRKAPGLVFAELGPQRVKNLVEPVWAYRLIGPGDRVVAPAQRPGPPADDRPSLVVLPLRNLGADTADDYFADGMVEELITGLARIRWLTVIARNSAFAAQRETAGAAAAATALDVRYVLEGSVRRAAARVRIATQLLDAATGRTLWAERFEGAIADVFELQDSITEGVLGAIEPTLKSAEIERARRKRTEDLGAWDHYLKALAHMYENTPEGRSAALEQVDAALALDPGYPEAHGVAAWCYFARSLWEGGLHQQNAEGARRHAEAVRASRTDDATTLAYAAIAYAFATRDLPPALEMIDRAIARNPSSMHAHAHGAVINTWAGNYGRSIALGERALRLSPFDPFAVMAWAGMAGARLMCGEHALAIEAARKGLELYPSHVPSHLIAIAALVREDRLAEAKAAAARFLSLAPGYRIAQPIPIMHHFVAEFRRAGLPD
jgi:TolB-like protein/class 3 adenylate cyclase